MGLEQEEAIIMQIALMKEEFHCFRKCTDNGINMFELRDNVLKGINGNLFHSTIIFFKNLNIPCIV